MSRRLRVLARRISPYLATAVLLVTGLAACAGPRSSTPIAPPRASTSTPLAAPSQAALNNSGLADQWLLLSVEEYGYAHLFAFDFATASLTRLTSGEQNDTSPSIAPDGYAAAFASDRDGSWDLYRMDLRDGSTTQLTDTPQYDGSPAWSPDMAWLAYETLIDGQLDISMLSTTDPNAQPVRLTTDPAADHSPAWSPDGRKLAFISNRTGDADVWLADLDRTSDRFTNISHTPQAAEAHPTWQSHGSLLAWASRQQGPGTSGIYEWDTARALVAADWIGNGSWPVWNANGSQLATTLETPIRQFVSAYALPGTPLILPSPLPGVLRGLAWAEKPLAKPLPPAFDLAAQATLPAPQSPSASPPGDVPSKRWYIVPLDNVQLSSAGLHVLVDTSFTELRRRVIQEAGWDALASLENAFVPLTTPLEPGLEQDW
ncbi:MAG TPA: hypothetical protein VFH29_00255, partial [Anaerolineales bacterium]|nr:hypothetical protein [Anaerolineales bacterium]